MRSCERSKQKEIRGWFTAEMQKVGDNRDISLLFFLLVLIFGPFLEILGPFWVIFGPLWAILGNFWAILGHFGSFFGHFLVHIFFGQKFISAIFITCCISVVTFPIAIIFTW